MTDPVTDWRGTPITPGALVVYGAPVGRSIAMVEATVATPMLTPSGRIWLDVVRRAYGSTDSEVSRVHVGADRLTVVSSLPASSKPTAADEAAATRARVEEYQRKQAIAEAECKRVGHERQDVTSMADSYRRDRCSRCGKRLAEAVKP